MKDEKSEKILLFTLVSLIIGWFAIIQIAIQKLVFVEIVLYLALIAISLSVLIVVIAPWTYKQYKRSIYDNKRETSNKEDNNNAVE